MRIRRRDEFIHRLVLGSGLGRPGRPGRHAALYTKANVRDERLNKYIHFYICLLKYSNN